MHKNEGRVCDADSRRPNSRLANRYARPAVSWNWAVRCRAHLSEEPAMDAVISGFVRAGNLDELKLKGRILLHGRHRPILLVQEGGRVLALDNRCPHMGFPLDRGSIEDGILTCVRQSRELPVRPV